MLEDIIKGFQKLKKDMEANIPFLEKDIDLIIRNKEKSSKRIERILDILLDYLYMGVGEKQFLKLNSYYSSFCPEYSKEYEKFYREIIDG